MSRSCLPSVAALVVATLACAKTTAPTQPPSPPSEPSIAPSTSPAPSDAPAVATTSTAPDPGTCPLGAYATWGACEGQRVRVEGRRAQIVHQHPLLTGPSGPGKPALHQDYLDVPGATQIILLTRDPVTCADAMTVVGTLRAVSAGGPPGTKGSYGGYAIEDAHVACR